MSDVVCELLKLLCYSGCNPGSVVAALSFHPPNPPFYLFSEPTTADGTRKIRLSPEVHPVLAFPGGQVRVERLLDTTMGCDVPLICFLVPDAKFTLLFSHGNATDLGGKLSLCP